MRIAMIPARLGSQRLKKKNLLPLDGVPLITRVVRRCQNAGLFDEIWINSESEVFATIAEEEGVHFHKRPEILGGHDATSEDFVAEFLEHHECERLYQVHSIAPLCSVADICAFVEATESADNDTVLSCVDEQIECAMNGKPVNFTFAKKENSQDLDPIQRITWCLTSWKRDVYLSAYGSGECATYAGKTGLRSLGKWSAHVIKTQQDMDIASAMLSFLGDGAEYGLVTDENGINK